MVRVSQQSNDPATAWRVRDLLAGHPLLGGAAARIVIAAEVDRVILEGWTTDERVRALAVRLAQRAAGRRALTVRLVCGRPAAAAQHSPVPALTQR
ncbi:hypothetical protein [uncultured Chloroflexus sp.]|uniref:hypothetical protein n=1 Tax=uncultured Chloroflexus sp. TaxID=214040 RepID=UPI00261680C4|nr:hypothetical protein [uncultured Chloroflexus sp.]